MDQSPEVEQGGTRSAKDSPMSTARFPKLSGDMVWQGSSFACSPKRYTLSLNKDELSRIERATRKFQSLTLPYAQITSQRFELGPELSNKLRDLSVEVHRGRGFVVIRGLTPADHTTEENIIMYMGIMSHIGSEKGADPVGMTLGHIRDAVQDKTSDGDDRPLFPSKRAIPITFHTDVGLGDIMSLSTQSLAKSGGSQRLASFWMIYNLLSKERPDVLEVLMQNWPLEGKHPVTGLPIVTYEPLVSVKEGNIIIELSRQVLTGTDLIPRAEGLPSLSAAQLEALELVDQLAYENCFVVNQQPGDILVVNNLSILHARDSWVDSCEHRRLLFRHFIKDPRNAWTKPNDNIDKDWNSAFVYKPEEMFVPLTDFDPRGKTACAAKAAHG